MSQKFLLVASFPDSILAFRGPLILALLARGLVVHVVAPDLPADSAVRRALTESGVTVHDIAMKRTGTNPASDLALLWRLFLVMRRIQPDFALAYTVKPVIYGSLAAWIARVPRRFALISGLGYAFTGKRGGRLAALIQCLYRLSLAKVQKVFFQNPDDQMLFRQRGILPQHTPSIVVNGSGVDVALFRPEPVPTGTPRFLMIGRLLGDKGVREYALAARRIRLRHPDVHFQLAGWIDENPDSIAQSELDEWVNDGSIEFLGRVHDVRPSIAAATVFVLPSYREGTPRSVLEAMAMQRPVITTLAPGCRETVVDGENGFLVPVQSVDALVAAMQRFIDDPALAPRMGARSRRIAEEKYDVHKVNEVMMREMGITSEPTMAVACHG